VVRKRRCQNTKKRGEYTEEVFADERGGGIESSDLGRLLVCTASNLGWQFVEQQSECCLLNVLCPTALANLSFMREISQQLFQAICPGTKQHIGRRVQGYNAF
jgi:hypothetical protein